MIKIPSRTHNIILIQSYVEEIFSKYHLDQNYFGDVLTTLTEAVNNAIIHGNREDENKFVHLHLKKTKKCLIFRISDEGEGFNPNNVPDPTTEEKLDCCGGRGVFLMNKLSHGINYLNNGSTVEIMFNL
ncbi:MAG: ATP-binding protein [Saprospiraceae bacterium]|nr:ATP-binding protein [Saprospiraceae bacterium]